MSDEIRHAARQAKHAAYVVAKRLRPTVVTARDRLYAARAAAAPYTFRVDRYRDPRGFFPFDFFLHRDPPPGWVSPGRPVPRVIRCLWTDDNPMSENRRRGLESLRAHHPDLPVLLVTPAEVDDLVVPGHPLHPAYDQLSAVHRSDYLRAYLLHHHGGGYSDLKSTSASWAPAFATMDADPDIWVTGYPAPDSDLAANLHGPVGEDVRRHWSRLVGDAACIARPGTPWTAQWLAEAERRLDYYARDLENHPATDPFGTNADYPVTWIGINADVMFPLQLKHLDHIRQDARLRPARAGYR